MTTIWSLGIANLDVITQPVTEWPEKGGLVPAQRTDFKIGGTALNAAVTIAKLGLTPVGLIGHLGKDHAGQVVKQGLEELGVITTRLIETGSASTGVCLVFVHPDGERSFIYSGGANNEISPDTKAVENLSRGDYLHIGGALCMPQLTGSSLRRLVERVRRQKVTVSLDTAWDGSGRWWKALAPSLPAADIFMTNLLEAQHLTGSSDPAAAARRFAAEGPSTVVVKMEAQGSYIYTEKWEGRIDPFEVVTRDTTGAGDAYAGSFLCGLARGWDVRQAGTFGNAVGALCVTAYGATEGIGTYSETTAFIRQQGRTGGWNWELG